MQKLLDRFSLSLRNLGGSQKKLLDLDDNTDDITLGSGID